MQIRHALIKVSDQEKALSFYTSVLGFVKKNDVRGGPMRWLTVSASGDSAGAELVLEPNSAPPARTAQKALYDAHFPAALLSTTDIEAEYRRLTGLGVRFLGPPGTMGGVKAAFFDDTCGNIIVLAETAA